MAIKVDAAYFDALADSVIDGEDEECVKLVNDGLAAGVDPLEAVEKGLAKGINQVGVDFGAGSVDSSMVCGAVSKI